MKLQYMWSSIIVNVERTFNERVTDNFDEVGFIRIINSN